MKTRYYALILTLMAAAYVIIIALSSQGNSITKMSISKIGSLEGNYLFFIIGTIILISMFSLFVYKQYIQMGLKPRIEVYLVPLISAIALLFRAGKEFNFARTLHTVLFVIAGILALILIFDLNQKYAARKYKIKKAANTLPKIAFVGTLALFLLIGLNVITEIIYIGAVLSWVNIISFST
ncbi:MAG: hypothetical protein ACP5N3_00870 [Candidatus Nanoarchaeia archaeon]